MHAPGLIHSHINVTTPAFTGDFLPTIMSLLGVETDNPTWIMDGKSLLELIKAPSAPRGKPIPISWGGQNGVIDENLKIINTPSWGQCDSQAPYNESNKLEPYYLFDVVADYHELHDLKATQPAEWTRMKKLYDEAMLSIHFSQVNETQCCDAPQPDSPEGRYACRLGGEPGPDGGKRKDVAARPPSSECEWHVDTGLDGADIATTVAETKEECCGTCRAVEGCTGTDLSGRRCHLKTGRLKMTPRLGTVSCVPV